MYKRTPAQKSTQKACRVCRVSAKIGMSAQKWRLFFMSPTFPAKFRGGLSGWSFGSHQKSQSSFSVDFFGLAGRLDRSADLKSVDTCRQISWFDFIQQVTGLVPNFT
jgi:hypothetical protein